MPKVLQYLIKREGIIVIVDVPERQEDEDKADFDLRAQRERELALHPDYAPE